MLDTNLVAEGTVVTAKGDGPVVAIGAAQHRVFLLQLSITGAVEQEAIDVSVLGGADEKAMGKRLGSFPQLFYPGGHSLLVDLRTDPEIKALRAHWEVNRWGRGPETPWFELGLKLTEVAPELMREREAKSR
jgi:hypothetical protein